MGSRGHGRFFASEHPRNQSGTSSVRRATWLADHDTFELRVVGTAKGRRGKISTWSENPRSLCNQRTKSTYVCFAMLLLLERELWPVRVLRVRCGERRVDEIARDPQGQSRRCRGKGQGVDGCSPFPVYREGTWEMLTDRSLI